MYQEGQGVPQDYAEAVRWYRKSAEQGDVKGQSALGLMYERGQGVAQDYVRAYMCSTSLLRCRNSARTTTRQPRPERTSPSV